MSRTTGLIPPNVAATQRARKEKLLQLKKRAKQLGRQHDPGVYQAARERDAHYDTFPIGQRRHDRPGKSFHPELRPSGWRGDEKKHVRVANNISRSSKGAHETYKFGGEGYKAAMSRLRDVPLTPSTKLATKPKRKHPLLGATKTIAKKPIMKRY